MSDSIMGRLTKSDIYKKWGLYIVCFCVCMVIQVLFGLDKFSYGDSADYWIYGERLWQSGRFNLLSIETGFRGYVFPLILGSCNHFLGGINGYKMLGAVLVSWAFVDGIPQIVIKKRTYNMKENISCVLSLIIFCYFFYGLIVYALTDLYAIIICIVNIILSNKIMEEKKEYKILIYCFLLGIGVYCVYNIRTIYLFSSMYILILFIYRILKGNQKIFKKILMVSSNMLGVVLAALPQAYLNYMFLGKVSIQVPTQGLMLQQMYWGLQYQRYETYIGTQQSIPQMRFLDPVGQKILLAEGFNGLGRWKDYFYLVFNYPLEIMGIYVRHFVNMLFPIWPNQYVLNMDNCKIIRLLLAFSCCFLFVLITSKKFWRDTIGFRNFIPVLVPVIFILPGAVESRFFSGMWIMVISMLCYAVQWEKLWNCYKNRMWKVAIVYVVSFAIISSMWTAMLASELDYNIFVR